MTERLFYLRENATGLLYKRWQDDNNRNVPHAMTWEEAQEGERVAERIGFPVTIELVPYDDLPGHGYRAYFAPQVFRSF